MCTIRLDASGREEHSLAQACYRPHLQQVSFIVLKRRKCSGGHKEAQRDHPGLLDQGPWTRGSWNYQTPIPTYRKRDTLPMGSETNLR